ncbi:hypothetical protein ACWEPC_49930, partial [Nonomuraea sp. NPDC004297]
RHRRRAPRPPGIRCIREVLIRNPELLDAAGCTRTPQPSRVSAHEESPRSGPLAQGLQQPVHGGAERAGRGQHRAGGDVEQVQGAVEVEGPRPA